jgi:hypothetical protein
MLKEKRRLFEVLFGVSDIVTVSLAWCLAYWVRFESGFFPLDKGRPDFGEYIGINFSFCRSLPSYARSTGMERTCFAGLW